ncbi:MAG: ribosome maturation factor RimP [Oscillospiraceae bacterium]|nr:ribosome maturation factor RimP [Oscillospiraceae bacterium]
MAKVTDTVAELAAPIVEQAGCTLWDVEYVKEAGEWFLRVYIDREGGVNIDHCEAVSRPLSDLLDEVDPIQGSYTFEVSSAGLDRILRKPEHYRLCMGQQVDVKLYRPVDGRKEYTGTLNGYEDGAVTVDGRLFEKKDIAQVRLHVTF